MYPRLIHAATEEALVSSKKVILLYGPRQVGKTTLVKEILHGKEAVLSINADQRIYEDVFSSRDLRKMQELIGEHKWLFIDEAQNISDIGINLKILHDEMPDLRIIATGSSSFELANKMQEALTGRTKTFLLYPIAAEEMIQAHGVFDFKQMLESLLLYGSYPDVLSTTGAANKIDRLNEISTAYLYKDILQLADIRYADKIKKLLQLIALQLGSTVSINELGKALGMSHETVSHYLDLLQKSFVLFRLSGYSGNPRKEITKMDKIYFYDLGIRNTLINNFNSLKLRNDRGAIWENFLLLERMKRNQYDRRHVNGYFWRTYSGVELDYLEEIDGGLHGYEMKWGKAAKASSSWLNTYPEATYNCITQENYLDFIRTAKD